MPCIINIDYKAFIHNTYSKSVPFPLVLVGSLSLEIKKMYFLVGEKDAFLVLRINSQQVLTHQSVLSKDV